MKPMTHAFLMLLCSVVYGQYKTELYVAQDGSGDFTTIQAAIDDAKSFPDERITITIKNGVYQEKVKVHSWNNRLTLMGESADGVVICWDDYFDKMKRGRNSTFYTATVLVQGDDFRAKNLIIENTAGKVGQAVALAVEANRCVFENCRMLGNQDTLYANGANSRQHYKDCYIEGTTDFIFGGATAFFENCTIHSKSNSYITASSTPEDRLYGFVFLNCKLTAADGVDKVYLGRPWRSFAKTVFIKCDMASHIRPEGWHNWNSPEKESTLFYAEGANTGPGADTANRVGWAKILTDNEINKYSAEEVLKPFMLPEMATSIVADEPTSAMSEQHKTLITEAGAVPDGRTLNTKAIQSAIDQLAADGGGTLVVPEGVFISGALFFKPGVNLHLNAGGVLKCASADPNNFPRQRTRIEGHFEEAFNAGLINADGCDGLRISGSGTLDGSGMPVWEKFWAGRKADKNFKNLGLDRARLCIIENSKDVKVSGVTFKDSQFWNLHFYNCQEILVEDTRFVVPDDYPRAPSTDGIDVDSCQDVVIRGCYFSVTDDCIALKGTKGPFALEDKQSKPVERIRISDCLFKRGGGVATCGSEATVIRDVVVENCTIFASMPLVRLKLRPDTPQHYEDLHFRNITMDNPKASLFQIRKWSQYFDPQGQPEPKSIVRNITISNIKGTIGSLGVIAGNRETSISNITVENVELKTENTKLSVDDKVKNLVFENVTVNGQPFSIK